MRTFTEYGILAILVLELANTFDEEEDTVTEKICEKSVVDSYILYNCGGI